VKEIADNVQLLFICIYWRLPFFSMIYKRYIREQATLKSTDSNPTNSSKWLPMFCLNLSLLCQVLSAGFGKQAAISMPVYTPLSVLSNHFYFFSMLCLGVQAVVWPIALRRYTLSFAYFYMCGSYVATLLMSYYLFHEHITPYNVAGSALIVAGVLIMVNGAASRLQGFFHE